MAMQLSIGPLCQSVLACGPFFEQTIFSFSLHPDLPLKLYAAGQIGVFHPSYARSYQIVAYRIFNDKPLTTAEQTAFLRYWHFRLGSDEGEDESAASKNWLKDRSKIAGVDAKNPPFTDVYRNSVGAGSDTYLNCASDAFKTASATLAKLVSKYGADSPVCKEWLKGQDAVFCHCQSPAYDYKANKEGVEPPFPQKLSDSAILELRQDRLYQMAAAYFYAQKLEDALKLFTAISEDNASPWRSIARYMVARTMVRIGTLSKNDGYDTQALNKAIVLLKQLAANRDFDSLKVSIANLIDFTEVRVSPALACQSFGKTLSSPQSAPNLYETIDDYIFALNTVFGDKFSWDGSAKKITVAASDASLLHSDDLTSWLWCMAARDPAQLVVAADNFKKHHNLAWTIAYATKLKGNEADVPEVLATLAKTPANSNAFASASYYRALLLLGSHKISEAQSVIDAALASPSIPPSAANDLALLQLPYADSLERFFALSFRSPAAIVSGFDAQERPDKFNDREKKSNFEKLSPVLVPLAAKAINGDFPLSDIAAGATSSIVAAAYHKQFAQAAFTRAVMLGDLATAVKMTPVLKVGYPHVAKQIIDFETAHGVEDQTFAAVFLMLKCPGMRPTVTGGTARSTEFDHIDDYQDNWWDQTSFDDSGDRGGDSGSGVQKAPTLPFLSASDKSLSKTELAKLKAQGSASTFMGKIVLAYGKGHPADPRLPEALALIVKATHLGPKDSATSKQAFETLHKKYAGSLWAKKTPYHY